MIDTRHSRQKVHTGPCFVQAVVNNQEAGIDCSDIAELTPESLSQQRASGVLRHPSAETLAAMRELAQGRGKHLKSVEELMKDLKTDN